MTQVLLVLGMWVSGAAAQTAVAPGNETIQGEQMKADLYYLAGDAMRGRLTGSAEYQLAADWIEARFARLGLKPGAGGGSYSHRFDLVVSRLGSGNRLEIGSGGQVRKGRVREDYYPLILSATASAEGNAAFVGFGIEAKGLGWDDYAGGSVAGKIVVMFDNEPGPNDPRSRFDGVVASNYSTDVVKVLTAQAKGAVGVLMVSRNLDEMRNGLPAAARGVYPDKAPHLERYTLAAYAERIRIPAMQISPALARQVLGMELGPLLEQAEAGPWKRPVGGAQGVKMNASLERTVVADRSIVAMIEGTDPKLKDEAVIVSAHYDHNGATAEQIFAGADDNGSGTVALLEIAEAYALAAAQGKRPRRTVLFAAWGSEERCCGPLLGAWAWVEKPGWPLKKTVAVLNMDMIGRSEEAPAVAEARFNGLAAQTAAQNANNVNIIGWSYSPDLSAAVTEANARLDLTLLRRYDNNRSNLLRRSDQWPFLQRGVAALWFHTGLHRDYHTQYDRPERIEYGKMERVGRLVHQLSWNLANREQGVKMVEKREIPAEAQ